MFGDRFIVWLQEQMETVPGILECPYKVYACIVKRDFPGFRKLVNGDIHEATDMWQALKQTYEGYKSCYDFQLN